MDLSTELAERLKESGVDLITTYPGAKIQQLLRQAEAQFSTVPITKEEEGVGICAGASLAGAHPAMLIQSTGLGNMINALCSLTLTYQLPLLVLASWRGVYQENIPAQIPLGNALPQILQAIGCKPQTVTRRQDLLLITQAAEKAYNTNTLQVVLLHPRLWDETAFIEEAVEVTPFSSRKPPKIRLPEVVPGKWTRFHVLQAAIPFLEGKLVICNIGFPSRELYSLHPQPSNFYMLGSLGLASSIGLGVALQQPQPVVVIDGDGSLLSNLGSLATIAQIVPQHLTLLAIDNGAHGSTGNQPTTTRRNVDLAFTARGLGIKDVARVSDEPALSQVLDTLGPGPNFIHILCQEGNASVPTIPLSPFEIKQQFMQVIRESRHSQL